MNLVDKLTYYGSSRIVAARDGYQKALMRSTYFKPINNNKLPGHLVAESLYDGSEQEMWSPDWLARYENEMRQKLALTISWIYSDIDLIARECGAVDLYAESKRAKNRVEKVFDNETLDLMNNPNDFMTKTYLMRYLIYWLQISNRGAFIYMAPEQGNLTNILELWPINPNQIRVVRTKTKFVKEYRYYPINGTGGSGNTGYHRIDPRYMVWLRYPDPFFDWGSLPPLQAAMRSAEISLGITESQKKLFVESKGLPLTLVSVDPDINNPDFATVKRDIRDDWESGNTTIAVTRGGDISVASLGFTQKDLETIQSQQLTRDEIDSVFFGYPIRSSGAFDGDGIKEGNRLVVDKTIYPLLKLISEHLTKEIQHRFYDKDVTIKFEDVRQYDKALEIQSKQVDSRFYSMDEMRERDGEQPIKIARMPDIGELPTNLANNPQFIAVYYNLTPESKDGGDGADKTDGINAGQVKRPKEVGNVSGSMAPEATANRIVAETSKVAAKVELSQRKKVAKRALSSGGDPLAREFTYKVLDIATSAILDRALAHCTTDEDIDLVFESMVSLYEGEDTSLSDQYKHELGKDYA